MMMVVINFAYLVIIVVKVALIVLNVLHVVLQLGEQLQLKCVLVLMDIMMMDHLLYVQIVNIPAQRVQVAAFA